MHAAGLDDAVFHELRHYYASLLIRHGDSVKVVQDRLGHATTREAVDVALGSCPGCAQNASSGA